MAQHKKVRARHLPAIDYWFIAAVTLAFFMVTWQIISSPNFVLAGDIVTHVDTGKKIIALTFDDGPLPGTTEATLNILAKEHAKATFFVIGKEAQRHPAQLQKIIAAGHEVGNHSYSHRMMAFLPPSDVAREVENTDALLRRAGYSGEIPFRAPYHLKFVFLPYYLAAHERPLISRDVIPLEGKEYSAQSIASEVLASARPGSIVLMHTMYKHTASSRQALPRIIDALKQDGYEFVTVSELLASGSRQYHVSGK